MTLQTFQKGFRATRRWLRKVQKQGTLVRAYLLLMLSLFSVYGHVSPYPRLLGDGFLLLGVVLLCYRRPWWLG
jgi:hypothetical protein